MLKLLRISVILWMVPLILFSQNPVEEGEVFRDDVLPKIHIRIHPDSLAAIYANPKSDHEYPASFEFDNGFLVQKLDLVGFRVRGNTSRVSQKKSFKVSFNTFDSKQKFFGLEKMNLNGEHNDPSVIRSKLGWELARDLGLDASRSNHILLYINDKFWGVYIHVEHVDEEFVNLRFGSKTGNLYKCLWPAALEWRGGEQEAYKNLQQGERAYALKTNTAEDDYSDLVNFIDVLNNTSIRQLGQELPKVFNVERYLAAIVLDVFIGNWDGPIYNKNNFYLYHNPESGQFEYIPYDLDNTFGIDWFSIDWETRNVYTWGAAYEKRPLYERILEVPEFREKYTRLFYDFLQNHILNGELEQDMAQIKGMIEPYIPADPFYRLDYGWVLDDFRKSYVERLRATHVKSGLQSYIQNRTQSALNQLDVLGINHFSESVDPLAFPNPAGSQIFFSSPMRQVEIFDLSGRLIRKWDQPGHFEWVSILGMQPGIYVLRMLEVGGQQTNQLHRIY